MAELRYDRIDESIRKSPLSVGDLAELAEVSPEYLWKLRHGKAPNVSAVVLQRLAEALGVPVAYFLGAERNDQGMPVAEVNIASAVARINTMSPPLRAVFSDILSAIFRLLEPENSGELFQELLIQLYEESPDEDREALERAVQRAQTRSQLRVVSGSGVAAWPGRGDPAKNHWAE